MSILNSVFIIIEAKPGIFFFYWEELKDPRVLFLMTFELS